MAISRTSLAASIARLAATAPVNALANIELAAQLGQGKGWGACTVEREVAAALELLRRDSPSERVCALDVGANIGDWTIALLKSQVDAEVHAFEPSKSTFGQLEQRTSHLPTVHRHQLAVGNHDGDAMLFSDSPGSGLASLHNRRLAHFGIEFRSQEEVPVQSLDSWSRTTGVRPNLVKLDVEGNEFAVLSGASECLQAVQVIQFEFGGCNIDSRTYFQDFWYFFQARGFHIHRLGPRGLARVETYSEQDECFRTTNYYAVRDGGPRRAAPPFKR